MTVQPLIVHIVHGLGAGGTEMTCLRLAKHWQSRFRQHVVALQPGSRLLERAFDEIENCSLTIAPENYRGGFARWWWLRSLFNANSPDAVLMHVFGVPHMIAASAARSSRIKSIAVKAGNPPPKYGLSRHKWAGITLASRLLGCPIASCSAAVDQDLRNLGAGMPNHSRPLHNGIDVISIADEAERARAQRKARPAVVGMVARLDTIKDHKTLIEAFSLAHRKHEDCELWIIGEGELRNTLEEQARKLGIADCTKLLGNRSDIPALLGQMDVYAFSTTPAEGFGIALIEAMAAGVAIVATDVPACREVLADGTAGLLVPPGNAQALGEGICELLRNRVRRESLAAAANIHVRREYGIEKCAARWESLLFRNSKCLTSAVAPCVS